MYTNRTGANNGMTSVCDRIIVRKWVAILTLLVTIIIGLVLAYLVYHYIHRLIIRRATAIVRNDAQQVTDQAMKNVLKQLVAEHKLASDQQTFIKSETVADVWGRGVMAFEYELPVSELTATQLPNLRRPVNNALGEYALANHIKRIKTDQPTFVVTDLWLFEQRLHIDIAYLVNEATIEYVQDLRKLNASQAESLQNTNRAE